MQSWPFLGAESPTVYQVSANAKKLLPKKLNKDLMRICKLKIGWSDVFPKAPYETKQYNLADSESQARQPIDSCQQLSNSFWQPHWPVSSMGRFRQKSQVARSTRSISNLICKLCFIEHPTAVIVATIAVAVIPQPSTQPTRPKPGQSLGRSGFGNKKLLGFTYAEILAL